MRMPTADALEWHRKAMAGENPPVTHEPQPGFFLRKDGPGVMVPCKIWLEQPIDPDTGELLGDEVLLCSCGGTEWNAEDAWTYLAKRVISQEEYEARLTAMITGEPLTEEF